ncbi:TatD family deoxyribonuclease [Xylanibacillus composti]|uniref:TatD DNase family protein n=1 Tax=Xylanibacillus composti TaxID=1572762 RepID=A0A8J4H079_9BACL|nr:TatD family hydrolase [Xylanibacillus composti]MDT9723471.1 TatD family deoxyribonuclease [Xylanibacillus composti]GIQ68492.1 hypothetical protein XYCOK13_13160 [Xylanibacillus composti]
MIDAHIHLDMYEDSQLTDMLAPLMQASNGPRTEAMQVTGLITVSSQLESCRRNLQIAKRYPGLVHPAFGFHPEQPLPDDAAAADLFQWMRKHADDMVAIGEVGLPYYTALEKRRAGERFDAEPYQELLEQFVRLAGELNKPIVLHAVYEDAAAACELLEKYNVSHAHFHWFKASRLVTERIIANQYSVSFTPDICYEPDIRQLAAVMPIDKVMAETDGPWPFEGPFKGQATVPRMAQRVIQEIAGLKRCSFQEAHALITQNTASFYRLPPF